MLCQAEIWTYHFPDEERIRKMLSHGLLEDKS